MSYFTNFWRHTFAILNGEVAQKYLQRDFWPWEDVFSAEGPEVRWRWLKLFWCKVLSILAASVPLMLLFFFAIGWWRGEHNFGPAWYWWFGLAVASIFGLIFGTTDYFSIRHARKKWLLESAASASGGSKDVAPE